MKLGEFFEVFEITGTSDSLILIFLLEHLEGRVIIKKSNICPTLVFAMVSNLHDQNMKKPQNRTNVGGWVFAFVNNLRFQFLKAMDE